MAELVEVFRDVAAQWLGTEPPSITPEQALSDWPRYTVAETEATDSANAKFPQPGFYLMGGLAPSHAEGMIEAHRTKVAERMVVKPEELQEKIRDEAAKYSECGDAYFGGVYWHEPDETGCNWSISSIRGRDWSGCLDRLGPFAARLRSRYNVPNPAKGISYRDCQVAIEAIPEKHGDKHEFVASWLIVKDGQVRKFGSTIGTYPNPGEALVAGEALAVQDVDQGYKDAWLR